MRLYRIEMVVELFDLSLFEAQVSEQGIELRLVPIDIGQQFIQT